MKLLTVIVLASCVSCGQTTGHVHVSQPLVHARERLVDERVDETQWLRSQLDEADEIETRFQGYRDFREFFGFYNSLRVGIDPAQGDINRKELRNQEIALQTEEWKLKTAELKAKQDYLKALESGAADVEPPNGSQQGAPTSPQPPTEDQNQFFGKTYKDLPSLPDPNRVVETKAQAEQSAILEDRRAYRANVHAAIREIQLDDAHDVRGMMLYELTSNLTVVPGDNSQRYVQVTLELPDPPETRYKDLVGLHDVWKEGLRRQMIQEIVELYSSYQANRLASGQKAYLQWCVGNGLREVYLDCQSAAKRIDEETAETTADKRAGTRDEHARRRGFTTADDPGNAAREAQRVLQSLGDRSVPEILSEGRIDGQVDVLSAIAFAVWAKYRTELSRIVAISPPAVSGTGTNYSIEGLAVAERTARVPKDDEKENEREGGKRDNDRGRRREHDLISEALTAAKRPFEVSDDGSDSGIVTFMKRIMDVERSSYAIALTPKEHAQNVSEVSARESVVNLIFAVQAVFATAGVNAQDNAQLLKRQQEILHAITRRPVLVGFGLGGPRFGWVAGPRFTIVDGEAEWLHTPVRHDVSVAIVVPAWKDAISVKGDYAWVDDRGETENGNPLWDHGTLTLRVPKPNDALQRMTMALASHGLGVGGSTFRLLGRQPPSVSLPEEDQSSRHLVYAGVKGQSLLILGKELWRNPQVFLGSQAASDVKVLADMEGLRARFDDLHYPGTAEDLGKKKGIEVDLTVVTSYGRAIVKRAGTILPPPSVDEKSKAELLTSAVTYDYKGAGGPIALRIVAASPREALFRAYRGLEDALKLGGGLTLVLGGKVALPLAVTDQNATQISLAVSVAALISQRGELAKFKKQPLLAEIRFNSLAGTGTIEVHAKDKPSEQGKVTVDETPPTKHPAKLIDAPVKVKATGNKVPPETRLRFVIPVAQLAEAEAAYEGLGTATTATLEFYEVTGKKLQPGSDAGTKVQLTVEKNDVNLVFTATGGALNVADKLLAEPPAVRKDMTLKICYDDGKPRIDVTGLLTIE